VQNNNEMGLPTKGDSERGDKFYLLRESPKKGKQSSLHRKILIINAKDVDFAEGCRH
jgi:hypothetical protein